MEPEEEVPEKEAGPEEESEGTVESSGSDEEQEAGSEEKKKKPRSGFRDRKVIHTCQSISRSARSVGPCNRCHFKRR